MGNLHTERRIAGTVGSQFPTVEVHSGDVGRTVELEEQPFPCQLLSQRQLSPVAADHLIGLMVGIVLRKLLNGMGQPDSRALPFSQREPIEPLGDKFPVIAQTQHMSVSLYLLHSKSEMVVYLRAHRRAYVMT